jgi:asparagine synthase (glutamine-hydrolysing)
MSGLAVLFHRDGRPVEESAIAAMLTAIPYRGPDGLTARLWDDLALGCAQMITTPEEAGRAQPLVSLRTGCAIIADARLDNREALLGALPEPSAATASDAELILHAYEAWELDAPARLLGDFAFVLWDPRRQRLVCARDTSGQRPLYYRVDRRTFAAASEIHQLLQDPAVPVAPNHETIRASLVPINVYRNPKEQAATFYEGVSALPAAHWLTVDHEGLVVRRYWQLTTTELRYRRENDYAEHCRELLFTVVRAHLRSRDPVGALLSGGLDSCSVVCIAEELYRQGHMPGTGLKTISSVFEGLDCDERPWIQDVVDKYGIDARYIPFEEMGAWLQLEPLGFQPLPSGRASDGKDTLWRLTSELGVRSVLTGDIADSCVLGSRLVFDSLLRQGRFRSFWRHFQAFRRGTSEPLRTTLAIACVGPLLPLELQKQLMTRWIHRRMSRAHGRLLPAWMPAPLCETLSRQHLELCLAAERGRRFSSLAREEEYRLLYPPELKRDPAGWPIEVRRPFADRRLHEFLLSIPPEQKFAPHPETDAFYAGSKRLIRRGLRGILPESVRTRQTKTIFDAVTQSEVVTHWAAYEAAFGPGAQSEVAVHGYVDPPAFWERLLELRSSEPGRDHIYLHAIVALETWLRSFKLPRSRQVTAYSPWKQPLPALRIHREARVPQTAVSSEGHRACARAGQVSARVGG